MIRLRADSRRLPAGNGMGLPHQLREILSGYRLLLEKSGDDCVEGGTVVTEQGACSVLSLCEQAADFLVDDLLGCPRRKDVRPKGEAASWEGASDP